MHLCVYVHVRVPAHACARCVPACCVHTLHQAASPLYSVVPPVTMLFSFCRKRARMRASESESERGQERERQERGKGCGREAMRDSVTARGREKQLKEGGRELTGNGNLTLYRGREREGGREKYIERKLPAERGVLRPRPARLSGRKYVVAACQLLYINYPNT